MDLNRHFLLGHNLRISILSIWDAPPRTGALHFTASVCVERHMVLCTKHKLGASARNGRKHISSIDKRQWLVHSLYSQFNLCQFVNAQLKRVFPHVGFAGIASHPAVILICHGDINRGNRVFSARYDIQDYNSLRWWDQAWTSQIHCGTINTYSAEPWGVLTILRALVQWNEMLDTPTAAFSRTCWVLLSLLHELQRGGGRVTVSRPEFPFVPGRLFFVVSEFQHQVSSCLVPRQSNQTNTFGSRRDQVWTRILRLIPDVEWAVSDGIRWLFSDQASAVWGWQEGGQARSAGGVGGLLKHKSSVFCSNTTNGDLILCLRSGHPCRAPRLSTHQRIGFVKAMSAGRRLRCRASKESDTSVWIRARRVYSYLTDLSSYQGSISLVSSLCGPGWAGFEYNLVLGAWRFPGL